MAITRCNQLDTSIDVIDAQHRRIVGYANQIVDAIAAGDSLSDQSTGRQQGMLSDNSGMRTNEACQPNCVPKGGLFLLQNLLQKANPQQQNMEAFRWTPSFITGLTDIDDQHHRLIDLINRFGELVTRPDGAGIEDLEGVFAELADYARYHFSEEETLMREMGLDVRHIAEHRQAHKSFFNEVTHLHDAVSSTNLHAAESLLHFLTHWLTYHILGSDQFMAKQIASIKSGCRPEDTYEADAPTNDPATGTLLTALNGLFHQVSERNRDLVELNRTLEARVAERTQELNDANQRALESEMGKSLAVLRHVIGNISQGITMVDADLNLVFCNHHFLEMRGFPESLGTSSTPYEVFVRYNAEHGEYGPGDVEDLIRKRLEEVARCEPSVVERRRADGTVIEVVSKPLPEGGFIATYTDITERKRIELAQHEFTATLERTVADRTEALQRTLGELSSVIHNLEQAQDELVRSAKLAALGSMVAGVAHELNTPIGNSLMVASHLASTSAKMKESIATGLRRSVLDEFLSTTDLAADVLVRNLIKAAELVASFKQVAVDQTSSQRRGFALAEMVAEVVTTLGPGMRKTPYCVAQSIPGDICMESYPGPLGQVLTNLVNNAVVHGFEGRRAGSIRIVGELAAEGDQVVLTVSDDGKGMPPNVLSRIFDPFFTTKLGQGGSGLGLHIVHNIVFSILGGRISAESVPGQGTRFIMQLPVTAPKQAAPASVNE
jgi:hemerythrin-like metal-binding protein